MKNRANSGNSNGQRSSRALGQRELRIDELRLDQYAMAGLTIEELAATLNVPAEQLERDHSERIRRAAERGIGVLRRKAFEMAVVRGDVRVLCFLLTHLALIDPQLRELRELEIRERRLKLESRENEEKRRAQLALQLQEIQVQRGQLTLSAEQQAAAARQAEETTRHLESISPEELDARGNQIALEMKLLRMNPEQRQATLNAIPEILAQPMQGGREFCRLALLVHALDPNDLQDIMARYDSTPRQV